MFRGLPRPGGRDDLSPGGILDLPVPEIEAQLGREWKVKIQRSRLRGLSKQETLRPHVSTPANSRRSRSTRPLPRRFAILPKTVKRAALKPK